jgi:hypothetical protein
MPSSLDACFISHLAEPAEAPFGLAEPGCQGTDEILGHTRFLGSATQAEDIHMVVLDSLARRVSDSESALRGCPEFCSRTRHRRRCRRLPHHQPLCALLREDATKPWVRDLDVSFWLGFFFCGIILNVL